MMAPSIAALVGISYVTFVNWTTSIRRRRYTFVMALAVTVGVQAMIIAGYSEWRSWMLPMVIGAGLLAVILLGWQAIKSRSEKDKSQAVVHSAAFLILFIAPFAWSLTSVLYGSGNAAFLLRDQI